MDITLDVAVKRCRYLTRRQHQVAELLCSVDYISSKTVARKLNITHETVKLHLALIRRTIGLKSSTSLAHVYTIYLTRNGIIA